VCSAAIAEWTVTRNLGVGIGAALDWLASVPNGGGGRDQAWIVGVPLRMGVYFPTSRNADAGSARSAWSFSWSLTPGYAFAVQGFGTGLALVAMAGISYELY
jgi:hypothetical protein